MYSPPHYRASDQTLIEEIIKASSFATILTDGRTEQISHLPLLLRETPEGTQLWGHMARANPHWRELATHKRTKAIFEGPHTYISPAWYLPAADNVPTWNYAIAHVTGDFSIEENPKEAFDLMDQMVRHFETKYQTGWSLPQNEAAIDGLMRGIVVFRIQDLHFEGKLKMSQNQPPETRENVIQALSEQSGLSDPQGVAAWMERTRR